MTELDITLPSTRHVHQLIRSVKNTDSPQTVELKLVTGDVINGVVKWIDAYCICVDGIQIGSEQGQVAKASTMLIWHHAIAYIKS